MQKIIVKNNSCDFPLEIVIKLFEINFEHLRITELSEEELKESIRYHEKDDFYIKEVLNRTSEQHDEKLLKQYTVYWHTDFNEGDRKINRNGYSLYYGNKEIDLQTSHKEKQIRTDPILIQLIENAIKENDLHIINNFMIVELEDDIKWHIESFDLYNYEVIREDYREWDLWPPNKSLFYVPPIEESVTTIPENS